MNSRYIKTLLFPANKDEIQSIEPKVNAAVDAIKGLDGKIVSHYATKHGISPSFLIHTIVYERESFITEDEFNKALGATDGNE